MKCSVCGAESGKYPLCRNCNQLKEAGMVIKCDKCGRWHRVEQQCPVTDNRQPSANGYLYDKKEYLISNKEDAFFQALKKAVPDHYSVFPQINLATFITKTDESRFHNELFRNVDFLIADEKYRPRIAVEINDQTHLEKDRRERDEKVTNILEEAGIPLLTLWTSYGVNQEYINGRVNSLLNTTCERKHHFEKKEPEVQKVSPVVTPPPTNPAPAAPRAKKGCYVATCVYGSYDCPQVWTLRRFRDDHLDHSAFGRAFIRTYYSISPFFVKHFGRFRVFRAFWKFFLDRFVVCLNRKGFSNVPYQDKY